MKELHKEYNLRKEEIKSRLQDFKKVKGNDLFYELCFCILTPQSSGFRADECVQVLRKNNFLKNNFNPKPTLKKKIRFHNNKTKYLLLVKKQFSEIKDNLQTKNKEELREWLLKNIKGYGKKEVAHFMRNIGYENVAILDRHILKNLKKHNVIEEIPKSLTPKKYEEIEGNFKDFSKKINIPMDHLDLLFWARETGKVFK